VIIATFPISYPIIVLIVLSLSLYYAYCVYEQPDDPKCDILNHDDGGSNGDDHGSDERMLFQGLSKIKKKENTAYHSVYKSLMMTLCNDILDASSCSMRSSLARLYPLKERTDFVCDRLRLPSVVVLLLMLLA
jgi:hypothetical protein